MYYELYIDVFFFVNFLMDVCVLTVSKKILKCPATYGSICLGAMLGSFLTCIIVALQVPYSLVKFMVFHGVISILMIKTGLRIKWNRSFIRAYAVVYISAFLIGGVFSSFRQFMREGSTFFVFAIVSYLAALGVWNFISHMAKSRHVYCEVILCQGENQVKVQAIIDTGNRLRDSITGKPVSIISKKTANELWKDIPGEGLRYIPYHTIGKKEGVLPMLLLDRMCLYLDEKVWISKALIAIAEDEADMGKYEMILNSDIR